MDKCKEILDLILTDYVDGEVDQKIKSEIDAHLLMCADCRRLAQEVARNLVVPFGRVARETPPDHLWKSIEEKIGEENRSSVGVKKIFDRFIESLSFPRLAPALASFVVLILVGSTVVHNMQIKQAIEKEQSEYLANLLDPAGASQEADNNGSQTPIEKYFL